MTDSFLQQDLSELKKQHLYRQLKRIDGPQSARTIVDGIPCILLSSNNYLGLTEHPELKRAAKKAIEKWGTGSGGSRLTTGNLSIFEQFEQEIAQFKHTEAALVFNTGYMANLGIITALTGRQDVIISDELNHASIIDGCLLSQANKRVFAHKNMNELEKILQKSQNYRRRLIVCDGVFSMDGDIAPLPEMHILAERYDALLMIDDAHATGVLGKHGSGTAEYFHLEDKIPIQMGTLSKALGSAGAYVAGKQELIDYLRNKARSFIYSTALPPAVIGAALAALKLIQKQPEILRQLWANAAYLRDGLEARGFQLVAHETPILPVFIGDEQQTMLMAEALKNRGVFAPGIRQPTVAPGEGRIRVTVMASHSRKDLDEALAAFEDAGKELGIV
jgi:glycine C-acetyltransferase/8-amino-7-oxononanoate synthase